MVSSVLAHGAEAGVQRARGGQPHHRPILIGAGAVALARAEQHRPAHGVHGQPVQVVAHGARLRGQVDDGDAVGAEAGVARAGGQQAHHRDVAIGRRGGRGVGASPAPASPRRCPCRPPGCRCRGPRPAGARPIRAPCPRWWRRRRAWRRATANLSSSSQPSGGQQAQTEQGRQSNASKTAWNRTFRMKLRMNLNFDYRESAASVNASPPRARPCAPRSPRVSCAGRPSWSASGGGRHRGPRPRRPRPRA